MKIDVITLYKAKYKSAYLINHKDGRKRVYLIGYDNSRIGMSYAAYLWEDKHKIRVPSGYEVDHINNDKTYDRIENLQLLSKADNIKKKNYYILLNILNEYVLIVVKRFYFLKEI